MVSSNTKLTKNTDINLVRLNLKISITGALMLEYISSMLISFYSVQSGSRKHWKQGKGNGGWKWRISLCCWYLRCDWELPFLLRVRLLRSKVPRFWWVELLRWRAESNKQVAPLWHSHTIERKGRAIYLQPLFNRGLYQQKGNWSNGDMTDSYNLKDHICIELFSFMVMLSK